MTRTTRSLPFVFAAAACGATLALLSACSGDDNTTTPPGNTPDASNDGTVTPLPDASGDAPVDSTTPNNDAGDASTTEDAGDSSVACTPFDAGALDDAAVQAGFALVETYGCAKCHQSTPADAGIFLSGNDAHNFLPDAGPVYPPNLTPDPATGLGCWSNADIRRAILEGIDDKGTPLCVMPKFATKGLDAGGADEIVAFLRTLHPVVNAVPESVCPVLSDGGTETDGGEHDGDVSDGEATDGQATDGEATDGQAADGGTETDGSTHAEDSGSDATGE